MIWSLSRIRKAFELLPAVVKKSAYILLPLSLVMWSLKYGVSTLHHLRFDSPEEFSMGMIIGTGLGAFILDTLMGILWFVVATLTTATQVRGQHHPAQPFFQATHQTLIEDLRKTFSVILWTFAFILPGLRRWIQLTFTCFVSLLHPGYQKGQVDALQRSEQLVQGKYLAIGSLVLVQVLLITGIQEFGSSFPEFSLPLIFLYGLSWFFGVYCAIYLTLTYGALDPEVQL